jgi:hypothetical protein
MGQGTLGRQRISSIPVGYDQEGRPIRVRRRKRDYDLIDTLLYPLVDGPGVAMLVFTPPLLALMTLPVIDLFTEFGSRNALNPVLLLLVPVALPLIASFTMAAGYILLYYGRVVAASAFGEDDHPRWPSWDMHEIAEGLGRWIWAALMGCVVGGFPALVYWINCGDVDFIDGFIFGDLAAIGLAYALMALAASMLNENIVSANPLAVVTAIGRVGWDYVAPCVLAALGIVSTFLAWRFVLFHSPSIMVGVLGLWACWVWGLYQGMVIARALGLLYHKHTDRLGWFERAPRWGA